MSDRIEAEILDVLGEEVAAAVDTPLVVIEGPKGDPGAPGKDGNPGAPGKDGAPGIYYGTTQPTGDTHPVWIDPDGGPDDGGLMSSADKVKLDGIEDGATKTIVDDVMSDTSTNPVQNKAVKAALDTKAGTEVATASANGLMSKDDKTKLDGVEVGANKTTVDAALDSASENPVQNKAVKAALDGKLDKTGGTLTGNLRVTGALFSGDGLSFGTGENIHFTKAADDAGKLAHGAAGVDDTVPLARLKVATPTEDDDAATKAYVDNNAAGAGAVRYDAAQALEAAQQFQARQNINAAGVDSPQFKGYVTLAPANAPLGTGVGLSPSGSGNDFTLDISDVNEGTPTLLTGVKTPTDAYTNAAATVEYVKAKVASGLLPAVTADDNGKILRVVSSAWSAEDMPTGGTDIGITGATVGQIAKITAVDDTGKPTAWEPVDMPSGGGSEEMRVIKTITITAADVNSIYFNRDDNGLPFELTKHIRIRMYGAATTTGSTQAALFFRAGQTIGDASQANYPIKVNSNNVNYIFDFVWDLYSAVNCWYGDYATGRAATSELYRCVPSDGNNVSDITVREIKLVWSNSSVFFQQGATIVVEGM